MVVLSYTYDSTHIVNLTVIGNFSIFNQSVDNIPSFKQSGIKEAIHAGKLMFTLKESTRNIIVLLTDGLANHDRTPQITKNMTAGMDLLVVGVGPNINQIDLKLIAGESKTFVAPTFDYLASENFGNRIVEGNSRFYDLIPIDIYMFKVTNKDTRTTRCSMFISLYAVLLSLLLTLNKYFRGVFRTLLNI